MTTFLLAPTEHAIHQLTSWKLSSLPERHGCDVLALTKTGIIGFQRKTLPDLVASLQDGRLYYELNQLQSSATVTQAYLIVESNYSRTADGSYFTEANISTRTLRSIVAKFQTFHVGYLPTDSPRDTIDAIISVSKYLASGRASAIHRPKNVRNEWGQVTNKGYGVHLLQSFPGIGPAVASAIFDHFGTVPIAWSVTAEDLAQVPGVGKKRADALLRALRG